MITCSYVYLSRKIYLTEVIFVTLSSKMPLKTGKFQVVNAWKFRSLSNGPWANLSKNYIFGDTLGEIEPRKEDDDEWKRKSRLGQIMFEYIFIGSDLNMISRNPGSSLLGSPALFPEWAWKRSPSTLSCFSTCNLKFIYL